MIFISYRRLDTAGHAGRLFDRLAARFGRDRVFMDVDTIQPGEDFAHAIVQTIESCQVLIVLIGDQWLNAADRTGQRRLDDPADLVRLEITTALKRGIPVFPVLVEGTRMPREDELPEALKPLARRQALEISDSRFDAEAQELVNVIERHLPVKARGASIRFSRRSLLLAGMGLLILAAAVVVFLPKSSRPPPPSLSGPWRGEAQDPGQRPFTILFDFRTEGDLVLGTVDYPTGTGSIEDGRINGRRVSFITRHTPQFEDKPAVVRFAGTLVGTNELRLTMQSDTRTRDVVVHPRTK